MTDATQPAANAFEAADGPSAEELADIFDLGFAPSDPSEPGTPAPANSEPSVGADGDKGGAPASTPAAPPASSPADPAAAQPASQEPGQPSPAAPLPTPTPEQLELASVKAELAALKAATPAAPTVPAEPVPAAPAPAQEENKPRFPLLQLPNEIKEGLASEDPEHQAGAISALVSGLANTIHATVFKDLEPKLAALQAAIDGPIQAKKEEDELTAAANTAKGQRDLYFQHFPAHNNPKLMPIISSELQELAKLHPNLPFDDQFVAALGARVNAYLAELGAPAPQVQPNPAPAPAPRSPAPPPASLTPGTRGSDEMSLEDEIAEVLEF